MAKSAKFEGAVIVLLGLALGGCSADSEASGDPSSVDQPIRISSADVDLEGLEETAETACKCVRSGGDDQGCWKDYETRKSAIETKIYGPGGMPEDHFAIATACAPVSTELECFDFSDGEHCIVTGYDANGASEADRGVLVCTRAEAKAIEEGWNQRSQEGIDRVMARIRRGEVIEHATITEDGCV